MREHRVGYPGVRRAVENEGDPRRSDPRVSAAGGAARGAGQAPGGDRAGRAFWDAAWAKAALPAPVDPTDPSLQNTVNRRFDAFFRETFSGVTTSEQALLEVGCGRSAWLPYFALRFGFSVAGLDYSPIGCRQAEQVLARAGVGGAVYCADLFDPPVELRDAFDVVVTFGVVEHFEDTRAAVRALGRFVRPGGLVITNVPNMVGAIGTLQRRLNRPVYDVHQPLDPEALRAAHLGAGLEVARCDYFLSTNFGVVSLRDAPGGRIRRGVKKLVAAGLGRLSMLRWVAEEYGLPVRVGRRWSPYINCVARRPEVE